MTGKRHEDGISTLEFALIAPVFLMIVMGIVEFSIIMFTSAVLENATSNTSRLGKTGYVAAGSSREDQILANIEAKTAGLLDPDMIDVTSEVYPDFDDIDQPEPCISPPLKPCPGVAGVNFTDINGNGSWDNDMAESGYGDAGDVVVYTVNYPWPVTTPIISAILGDTFNITSRSVVRNEPFETGP